MWLACLAGCVPAAPSAEVVRAPRPPSPTASPASTAPREVSLPGVLDSVKANPTPELLQFGAVTVEVAVAHPLPELMLDRRAIGTTTATRVRSISSSGPNEVWLADERGRLYRSRGATLARQPDPCPTTKLAIAEVRVSATQVVVMGTGMFDTAGLPFTPAMFARRPLSGGAFRCDAFPGNTYATEVLAALVPGGYWAVGPDRAGGEEEQLLLTEDGGTFPFPRGDLVFLERHWHMVDRDHGWLFLNDGSAWELRGAGWMRRPSLPEGLEVSDAWVDEEATVWVAGTGMAFFREGRWHRLVVPAPVTTHAVSGSAPNDVWFANEAWLYHFDGSSLARAQAPVTKLGAIHHVAGSGLWVGGGEPPDFEVEPPPVGEVVVVTRKQGPP